MNNTCTILKTPDGYEGEILTFELVNNNPPGIMGPTYQVTKRKRYPILLSQHPQCEKLIGKEVEFREVFTNGIRIFEEMPSVSMNISAYYAALELLLPSETNIQEREEKFEQLDIASFSDILTAPIDLDKSRMFTKEQVEEILNDVLNGVFCKRYKV